MKPSKPSFTPSSNPKVHLRVDGAGSTETLILFAKPPTDTHAVAVA